MMEDPFKTPLPRKIPNKTTDLDGRPFMRLGLPSPINHYRAFEWIAGEP